MTVQQGAVTLSGPLPPTETVTRGVPIDIFAGLTVTDPNPNALDTAVIGYDGTTEGVSVPAGYNGAPLTRPYRPYGFDQVAEISDQTPAALSNDIDQLVYTYKGVVPGQTSIYVSVSSSAGGPSAFYEVQINSPSSSATPFDPDASYSHGVFTLTGQLADTTLGGAVEITAVVDGVVTDLGAATVNAANGTFTFEDRIGNHTQSAIYATETYGGNGATVTEAPFSLTGGLRGKKAEQDILSEGGPFGPTTVLSTRFAANGLRQTRVEALGQTVELQPYDIVSNHHEAGTTFVYTPSEGTGAIDVIYGFKARGSNNDVLSFKGSDFGNSIADVLRNTGDVNGSAVITDPTTGDAIRLAGVTTAELKRKDFTFHA